MRVAKQEDLSLIKSYLKQDLVNCIYMYIDICTYGVDQTFLKVWVGEDADGITLVVMRYYNSLQLFTLSDNWDVKGVSEMIRREQFPVVNAKVSMLQRILPYCPEYQMEHGEVYQCVSSLHKKYDVEIEHASQKDFFEIANLICMDSSFAHYEPESLAEQLRERAENGMGRSLVIRKDDKIVAHIATFAEYENITVISGLIAHPQHKEYPYGSVIECAIIDELLEEGKVVYTFVTGSLRKAWMRAIGSKLVADYGKMILKA